MSTNSQSPSHLRFGRQQRIRNTTDFDRVYQGRCSASDNRLLVYALENETGATRLGVSVSRKVGGAVVRNRWKRILREAFRQNQLELPEGLDYVLIPRRGAEPELVAVSESLLALSRRVARRLETRRQKGDRRRSQPRRAARQQRRGKP